MSNLSLGIIYGVIAQLLSYIQIQGHIKYQLYHKYPILVLLLSIPMAWLYIKSAEFLFVAFDNKVWPGRFLGFAISIIMFAGLSYLMFKEQLSIKTILCVILAVIIMLIQFFMK